MGKYTLTQIPVIVMVGQSNDGGFNDDILNATITSESNGSIFYKPDWTSTNNGTWQSPILSGTNNVQYTRIGTYSDIGIELKLANLLFAYNGLHHYIIKLAYGGAELTDTIGQDDLNPDNVGEYYTIATDYTYINAIEKLAGRGKVRVKVIEFHQGESDGATTQQVADDYYKPLGVVDKDNPLPYFFQQFKAYHPTLNNKPVVITRVYTTAGGYPYTSTIAAHQDTYAANTPNTTIYEMDSSVAFSDAGVHWDAPTQELKAVNVFNIIKDY